MDRMPGRYSQPWCPYCHGPAGPDCADRSKSPRQIRRWLARELRRETDQDADPGAPGSVPWIP